MTALTCLTLPIVSALAQQLFTAPTQTNRWTSPGWRRGLKRQLTTTVHIGGGCSTQLIIKAATIGSNVLGHGTLTVGCDNIRVVQHGNSPQCPMFEKQPQLDVYWYFKGLMASSRIGGRMQHVYGHADKYLL
jgi:hypothetical protein